MRRLTATSLFVLIVLAAGITRAQSGRNRTQTPGTPSTGSTKQPTTEPSGDELNVKEPIDETVEGDVVRVNTNLVAIPVSVRDRDGRYAPDLTRADFQIFENGIEQRIAYFATVDQPFTVALLLDTSGSTDIRLDDIQDAAIAFVGQLKSEDRVMVIAFDDKIKVLAEPTNDRAELVRAIRRTRSGGSTRLYDAVDFVIKERLRNIPGRKAVVLLTDGLDTASRKGTYDNTLRLAEEFDALFYPVSYKTFSGFGGRTGPPSLPLPGRGRIIITPPFPGGSIPGGNGPTDPELRRADTYLQELALRTAGRFYRGDSQANIAQAFTWVAEELRRQYSLGYYPARPGQAGERRQIKVRVNRPNLIVLSRDSYVYPEKKAEDKEPTAKQLRG